MCDDLACMWEEPLMAHFLALLLTILPHPTLLSPLPRKIPPWSSILEICSIQKGFCRFRKILDWDHASVQPLCYPSTSLKVFSLLFLCSHLSSLGYNDFLWEHHSSRVRKEGVPHLFIFIKPLWFLNYKIRERTGTQAITQNYNFFLMLLGPSYLEPSKRKPGGNMNMLSAEEWSLHGKTKIFHCLPHRYLREILTPHKALKEKN